MSTPEANATLAWMDLETTGLEDDDPILEVALILTDPQLNVLREYEEVIRPTPQVFMRLDANPFVKEMHRKSGLLAELESDTAKMLPTLEDVEADILSLISEVALPSQMIMMAGGGVGHFDRGHVAKWMPKLSDRLHYGTIDVSDTVRGFQAATGNSRLFVKTAKAHRAMADVRQDLAIAATQWDMYQQHASRLFDAELTSTPAERVLAAVTLVGAASLGDDVQYVASIIDELSPRDAIAGLTAVAADLARIVGAQQGRGLDAVLDEVRLRVLAEQP